MTHHDGPGRGGAPSASPDVATEQDGVSGLSLSDVREIAGNAAESSSEALQKVGIPHVPAEIAEAAVSSAIRDASTILPNVGGVSAREGVSYGLREADVPDWAADAIGTVAGMGVHKGLQMGMDQLLGGGGGPTEEVTLTFECDGTPGARWEVGSGTYTEKLNDPYTLWLQLAADNDLDVEPIRMLGQSCLLIIQRGMLVRQVTGIVSEVQEGSTHPQKITTNIVVDPAFEVLRHRVNTKIFQNVTVPQILGEVLNEGLGAFDRTLELRLNRAYPTCEYRTQYNESDLAFCERLMEEEGIVYWFEFADDTPEKLVLSDDPNNYGRVECLQTSLGPSTLLYSEYEDKVGGHEFVSSFHAMSQLRPTKVSTRHFDWTHPSMPFAADANQAGSADPPNGALLPPEREVYQHDDRPLTFHEYGGGAFGNNDMNDQVRLRREAQGFDSRVAEGQSTALGVTTGQTFDLVGHPQGELDGRYLILSATHSFDGSGNNYQNQFQCIPAAVIYRPKRVTPKPRIPNIQTGTVVGPSGEEIHTDEHGRVKVQFHWDRLGAMDDHSSCWIRVSQPWAGSGWGFFFIPRIGMEVIVSFINGDPDLPLLTGSVYNSEHAPPYPLPDAKTMSTLKTESSLGGGGFNELRFEDMKNSEEVFIHAQKDFNEVVEHDHYTLIHHDQTNEVDNDHTELIHRDQQLIVDRHRSKHIKVNEETKVDGTRTETVDGDETITINSNRRTGIASNDGTNVGATYALTVGSKITIKTGKSSISMKKDGTIDIKGVKITVNGKELIKLQAAQIEEN